MGGGGSILKTCVRRCAARKDAGPGYDARRWTPHTGALSMHPPRSSRLRSSHARRGVVSTLSIRDNAVASAPPDPVDCPRCGQGTVRHVRLKALGITAYLCDECDALWQHREEIGPGGFVDFGTFMQARGRPGLWSEVTVLEGVDSQ